MSRDALKSENAIKHIYNSLKVKLEVQTIEQSEDILKYPEKSLSSIP